MKTWYEEIIDIVKKNLSQDRILALEIGTGLGHFSFELSKAFTNFRIISIDINESNLIIANNNAESKKINNIEWFVSDGNKLNFKDNSFDLVVSAFSLQYWNTPINILNQIDKISNKNAFVLITDLRKDMSTPTIKKIAQLSSANNPEASQQEIEEFLRIRLKECYTPKEILKIVKKSDIKNFKIIKKTYGFYLELKKN